MEDDDNGNTYDGDEEVDYNTNDSNQGDFKRKNECLLVERFENENIEDYKNRIYINSPGAMWDVFSFHEMNSPKSELLCMAQQLKKTDTNSARQMTIDDALFNVELKKVTSFITTDTYMF